MQRPKPRVRDPEAPIRVLFFVRVSKKKEQSYDRQVGKLTIVAKRQGYEVVGVVAEKGSASKRTNLQRPEIDELRERLRQGDVDKLLVTEFSRLGRMRGETPQLVEEITAMGISIYADNLGIETLNADGSRNQVTGLIVTIMIELDAMETERLAERIISGLEEAKRKGVVLGRPQGSVLSGSDLLDKYPGVVRDLKAGLSIRQVAKLRGIGKNTVDRIRAAWLAVPVS